MREKDVVKPKVVTAMAKVKRGRDWIGNLEKGLRKEGISVYRSVILEGKVFGLTFVCNHN